MTKYGFLYQRFILLHQAHIDLIFIFILLKYIYTLILTFKEANHLKYYKLLKGVNAGKVVLVDSNKDYEHFTYVFGKEQWEKTNIFSDFIWFENENFEQFQEINKKQAELLLNIQRQQITSLLRLAKTTATEAHTGQLDKGGYSYIGHPEYVANSVYCLEQKVVAWLHDVLEDTELTEGDLRELGFTESIIHSVKLLTRDKDVDYEEYLWYIRTDENAKIVKLADLEHNMDTSRLGRKLKSKDNERLDKYREAVEFLR